jgi:hypothetical protein
MLSVPTLWIVFVVNFLAMGLLWTYVTRSYPNFEAARYWTAAAFAAAIAAALGMARPFVGSLAPLVFAGTLIILACCLCLMGIRSFYGRRLSPPLDSSDADSTAARRSPGAHRWRRVLHRLARYDAA